MQATRRRVFPFDACSVLLFTALSLNDVTDPHAQGSQAAHTPPSFDPATTTPDALFKFTVASVAPVPAVHQANFDKADTHHDGKLSLKEEVAIASIVQRFHQWDTLQDGSPLRREFEQA